MPILTLKVGALNAGLNTELFRARDFADFIAGHFRRASGRDIELRVEWNDIAPVLPASRPAIDGDLHFGLRRLTHNPSKAPIDTIGLLIASSYESDNAMFGLMFDRGVPSRSGDIDTAVPREGAALFIDAIAEHRSASDLERECRFTSVHELGHVFNLWHAAQQPPTFMSRSAMSDVAYGDEAYFFEEEDTAWLGRCGEDQLVMPGGSPFIDRDGANARGASRSDHEDRLDLKIAVRPEACTRFEPIHLDLTVRLKPGRRRTARIPRMLDPAHDSFRIYIIEPRGKLRRYQSSGHCCPTARWLLIKPARPYRRDIVLLGEKTRYTFREAGTHRIFVESKTTAGRTLRSNTATVEILPDRHLHRKLEILKTVPAQSVLRYRRAPDKTTLPRLTHLIDGLSGAWDERRSLVAYRNARAVLESPDPLPVGLRSRAVEQLGRCRELGIHRDGRARELLEGVTPL